MKKSISEIASRGRVAFVQATWHKDIVNQLRDGFKTEFATLSDKQVTYFEVPGAYEIPLFAKALAESGEYAAVIAAGLVVDGGIYRHEFVASTVVDNLMRVQMDTGMPVFSAVLTPHHFHAGDGGERQEGRHRDPAYPRRHAGSDHGDLHGAGYGDRHRRHPDWWRAGRDCGIERE